LCLQNQSGDYLSTAYPTLKAGGGGAVLPQSAVDLLADIGIAAYFPRYGTSETAEIAFVTHSVSPSPGPPAQVCHMDPVRIVSRERQLASRNMLGIWAVTEGGSNDCFYYDEYVDGANAEAQTWVIRKVDSTKTQDVFYGDSVYLESSHNAQRLTRDTSSIATDNWITTSGSGEAWTIMPASARVNVDSRVWEIGRVGNVWATPQWPSRGWQVWTADDHSKLQSIYQDKPGGHWSGWMTGWEAGGPSANVVDVAAALHNQTNVFQVWARGSAGGAAPPDQLWSRWVIDPHSDWIGWEPWPNMWPGGAVHAIAACREGGTGRYVRLWVLDEGNKLRCQYLEDTSSVPQWTGWSAPGWNGAPDNLQDVCAVLQGDETIRVWISAGAGATATVYTAAQTSPGGDQWTPWTTLGSFYGTATLAACQIGDGGVQLWVVDRHSVLHSTQQTVPGEDWTPWDPPADQVTLPGWHDTGWLAELTAARQPGGEAGIWVVEASSRALHYKAQTDGEWGDWDPPFA
jgi:hypothetical protein